MDDVVGCLACDLSRERQPLPGGAVYQTGHWRIEHCLGPLGVGTLLLKPLRHVEHLGGLSLEEADELGPLLRRASGVVAELSGADQVYSCLWSHGPVHIHFVIQPETPQVVADFGCWGPSLQAAMFERADELDQALVEKFAAEARAILTGQD